MLDRRQTAWWLLQLSGYANNYIEGAENPTQTVCIANSSVQQAYTAATRERRTLRDSAEDVLD
jgi:hypothetical protein